MKITGIQSTNFRSYGPKGVAFLFSEGLNTIVGPNNSGKSNLIFVIETIRDILPAEDNLLKALTTEDYHNLKTDETVSFKLSATLSDSDIGFLMDELGVPLSLRSDFHNIFSSDLTIDQNYREGKLEKNVIQIGKMKVNHDVGIIGNTNSEQESEVLNWSDIKNSLGKGPVLEPQNYRNRRINFAVNFDRLIKILMNRTIIVFPEFRERPRRSEGLLISPKGTDLPWVLFLLKNAEKNERNSFKKIQDQFYALFSIRMDVRRGPDIVFTNKNELTHQSVGAGLVEVLIILTHLIAFEGRVFIIDEPELHLHPHSKRMLAALIKESSKRNQIICITHSTHFINMEEIRKITLVRETNGITRLYRISSPSEKLIDRFLPRIMASHQKEFFFAKSVLLVEGDTEFGAMPVLSQKMGQGFDNHGVSVLPVVSNYFAYFIALLGTFQIPCSVMCDEDTIMTITNTISIQGEDVRTSSLIKQLNDLDMLSDGDKNLIKQIQREIVNQELERRGGERNAKILSLVKSVKNLPCLTQTVSELSAEIENNIMQNLASKRSYRNEAYNNLVQILAQKGTFFILRPDFEGTFKNAGYSNLFAEAKKEFGKSKVLQGKFVAEKVSQVPPEIIEVIEAVTSKSKQYSES